MSNPQNFWTCGPVPDIFPDLLRSGLISSNAQFQAVTKTHSTEMPKKSSRSVCYVPCPRSSSRSISSTKVKPLQPMMNVSKPQTASTKAVLKPNYRPQPLEEISNIMKTKDFPKETARLLNTKEDPLSRSETLKIVERYNKFLAEIDTTGFEQKGSEEQLEIEQKLIYANLYSFDDTIKIVSKYNGDLTELLFRIKTFFKNVCDKIPDILKKAEEEKKALAKKNSELIEEINKLKEKIKEENEEKNNIQNFLMKTTEKLRKSEKNNTAIENQLKDAQYANLEISQKHEELGLKLNKCTEQKNLYATKIQQLEENIEENAQQIKQQEELIKKYEEEGAGFKPMYTKTAGELLELKKGYSILEEKLEIAQRKPETEDVGVDPIFALKDLKKMAKKLAKNESSNVTNNIRNISASRSMNTLKKDESKLSVETIDTQNTQHKPEEKTISNTQELKEEPEQSKETVEEEPEVIVTEEKIIVYDNGDIDALPPGYTIDHTIPNLTTTLSYLSKLLATNPNKEFEIDEKFNVSLTNTADERSFLWTLRQVISIFKDSFESDSLQKQDVSFHSIVVDRIESQYNNSKIVDRIAYDLRRSVVLYRENSYACQFYLRFVSGEYSVTDFRFFVLIFNILLTKIYPNVEETLNDADAINDFHSFTIHVSYADLVIKNILSVCSITEDEIKQMLKSAPNPAYPKLVSFWSLAETLIHTFQKAHKSLFIIIENAMQLIGSIDSDLMSREDFGNFMRIVHPFTSDKEIKEMWKSIKLACSDESSADTLPKTSFISYIGETKAISNALFEIPSFSLFTKTLNTMPSPVVDIFFYLKNHYFSVIPTMVQKLPEDVSQPLKKFILRIRNSLLNCDISTALMYYVHILQLIDLKCKEKNPIVVISPDCSQTDSKRIQNILKMREAIAYQYVCSSKNDESEILKEHKALAK